MTWSQIRSRNLRRGAGIAISSNDRAYGSISNGGGKSEGSCPGTRNLAGGQTRARRAPALSLCDVLEVFTRFEPNRPAWWDPYLLAGSGVAPDAPLAGLDLKDAKTAELDPLSALHRDSHRVEDRVHRDLGFHLGDVGGPGDFVHDVDFDHA